MRERMEELAEAIRTSLRSEPENFEGREPLWMEREELRAMMLLAVMPGGTKLVGACAALLALIPN